MPRYTKKLISKLASEKYFDKYQEDENLREFDIFHMYGDGVPCLIKSTGYHDSQNFKFVGFNTVTMKKREFERHDALKFDNCMVKDVRIFMDGSTMIKFHHLVRYDYPYTTQAMQFKAAN